MIEVNISTVVTLQDKIVVFYLDGTSTKICWRIIPRKTIHQVDQEQYLFYVHWPFGVYMIPDLVGHKVHLKLVSIHEMVIKMVLKVTNHYWLARSSQQRLASVKAIKRYAYKLMSRYWQGSFLTVVMKELFSRFLSAISNNFFTMINSRLDGSNLVAMEVFS